MQENYGRDHRPRCFTMWFVGGGIKPGTSLGVDLTRLVED